MGGCRGIGGEGKGPHHRHRKGDHRRRIRWLMEETMTPGLDPQGSIWGTAKAVMLYSQGYDMLVCFRRLFIITNGIFKKKVVASRVI